MLLTLFRYAGWQGADPARVEGMAASASLAQSSTPVREALRAVLTADSAQAHKARPSDPPALFPPVWQLAARFLRAEPLAESVGNPVFAAPRGAFDPRAPPSASA